MTNKFHPNLPSERVYDAVWFEALFLAMDRLHDDCSTGLVADLSPMTPQALVGWLEDIIYTAQEAVREIKAEKPGGTAAEADVIGWEARFTNGTVGR